MSNETKYYFTYNANRKYIAGGFTFVFDGVESFGGGWTGILTESRPEAQAALASFGPNVSVSEITEGEYLALKKKAKGIAASPQSPAPPLVTPAKGSLLAAGAVRSGIDPITTPEPVKTAEQLRTVDDVLVTGTATYVDPLDVKLNAKPKKKR
jgi:hypothetical protein